MTAGTAFIPSDKQHILVIRPDALGDVVLMIPFLNSLRKTYQEAKITVVLREYSKALLENHPSVDDVITVSEKPLLSHLVNTFKEKKYDIAFIHYLHGNYALATFLARIPIRIGDANKLGQKPFLTHAYPLNFRQIGIHEVEHNIRLLSQFNPNATIDTTLDLKIENEAKQSIATKLLTEGIEEDQVLIGIHPSTGGGNKAWTPQKYANLINKIHQDTAYKVVLTGFSQQEKHIINTIVENCTTAPLIFYQKTTLEELKALIARYSLIIGTDTGPTHMAAAIHTPVLCISPTKYVKALRWAPWSLSGHIIGHPKDCPISCLPFRCKLTTCLDSIGINQVFNAIAPTISKAKPTFKDAKKHWLCQSLPIAIDSKHPEKEQLIETLKKEGAIVDELDVSMSFFKLKKEIVAKDIGLVLISEGQLSLRLKLLTTLLSLDMYVPPLWMTGKRYSKRILDEILEFVS